MRNNKGQHQKTDFLSYNISWRHNRYRPYGRFLSQMTQIGHGQNPFCRFIIIVCEVYPSFLRGIFIYTSKNNKNKGGYSYDF